MVHYVWLTALGFALGTVGTLIGAGGGFILTPILLLLYPRAYPETITSISLAVVFFNALSGSVAYARMKRIDYRTGLLFAAATVPGAILGALTTNDISRHVFDIVLGLFMIAAASYLVLRRAGEPRPGRTARRADTEGRWHCARTIVESNGTVHTFSCDLRLGMLLSLVVGYVSSVLGIGGGIVHVPALVQLLGFPVHVATATSHFILVIMALTGTIVHIASGSFSHGGLHRTIALAIGVLLGAQLGAHLSARVHGVWILRGLAIALGLVGVRVLLLAF
ncbi:MAG: sulfite exporter TauE/SafE family protein [Candidatus Krumholzibacteriia bacterium]